MKLSLLSAAALLTLASSSLAADLPMTKAGPVEYVKICSEFGDGFYYIPGTDTCLRINGYVRADYWWFDPETPADDGLSFRGRGRVNFDARTATEWGTLRSFVSFEYNRSPYPTGNAVRSDKAFIQFGGWTAGYATSFYDFYDAEAGNTMYGTYFASSATTHLLAYTAVFGEGLAATISVEDNYYRRSGLITNVDVDGDAFLDYDPTENYGGQRLPDIVASLRWTQGWGSAQIMAAVHQNRTGDALYAAPINVIKEDEWGWAVGAGVIFNLPSGFFFALEGSYARGAADYAGVGDLVEDDVGDALGIAIGPNTDFDLSEAWSVVADLGYNFTPSLVGHLVGSYAQYDTPRAHSAYSLAGIGAKYQYYYGDFETWAVTANLTYTIVKGLTIAAEVSYEEREYDPFVPPYYLAQGIDPPLKLPDYEAWAAGIRLKRSF